MVITILLGVRYDEAAPLVSRRIVNLRPNASGTKRRSHSTGFTHSMVSRKPNTTPHWKLGAVLDVVVLARPPLSFSMNHNELRSC